LDSLYEDDMIGSWPCARRVAMTCDPAWVASRSWISRFSWVGNRIWSLVGRYRPRPSCARHHYACVPYESLLSCSERTTLNCRRAKDHWSRPQNRRNEFP